MNTPDSDSESAFPWRLHSPTVVFASGVLALFWFLVLLVIWLAIAGQAGSPQPDNWNTLERLLGIVEGGILVCLALIVCTPFACTAASARRRLAAVIPLVFVALCIGQAVLYLRVMATTASPHRGPAASRRCSAGRHAGPGCGCAERLRRRQRRFPACARLKSARLHPIKTLPAPTGTLSLSPWRPS